jgi:hypothetical protein
LAGCCGAPRKLNAGCAVVLGASSSSKLSSLVGGADYFYGFCFSFSEDDDDSLLLDFFLCFFFFFLSELSYFLTAASSLIVILAGLLILSSKFPIGLYPVG